ncbi:MurR/RpiR family transcriptional regulator [Rossellomorea sp. BNER]|jgi:DNA-binding MurR/RpiR family transcriptional regulator|uniref:MurR/RpiR family transcriptional regulator n=1 Tax=Rossellomorea sp. BNER TaxID=2962031 RepID=UPI003AF21349|nr:MurR/RpiR family transcriptional regulator [Rossellomorea sp. BNER]
MQTFFKRLLQHRDDLSTLEKQVLDFFVQNPERVLQVKLDELSKDLFVSTATISRTCQQIGFRGFQDFKYALEKNKEHEEENSITKPSSFFPTHKKRFIKDMELTLSYIDEDKIEQVANEIHQSTHVELFGMGNSLPPCVDAAKKLMLAGKICNAREDWDELKSVASIMGSNDLAILVSNSGETKNMLRFADILKDRNVKTVAITGRHHNQLQEKVHLSLHSHITTAYFGELDMCSRFPLSLVLDFIILAYLKKVKS